MHPLKGSNIHWTFLLLEITHTCYSHGIMYYKKITALCNYFQGCWLKLCNKFHQMQQINRVHTRSFMFVHLLCI